MVERSTQGWADSALLGVWFVKVTVQQPPVPLLRLDTWAILQLTKARHHRNLPRDQQGLALTLIDQIKDLVASGKLLCPEADQGIEMEYGERLLNEARGLQTELSRGVRTRYHTTVRGIQIHRVMAARGSAQTELILPYGDLFEEDPFKPAKS